MKLSFVQSVTALVVLAVLVLAFGFATGKLSSISVTIHNPMPEVEIHVDPPVAAPPPVVPPTKHALKAVAERPYWETEYFSPSTVD